MATYVRLQSLHSSLLEDSNGFSLASAQHCKTSPLLLTVGLRECMTGSTSVGRLDWDFVSMPPSAKLFVACPFAKNSNRLRRQECHSQDLSLPAFRLLRPNKLPGYSLGHQAYHMVLHRITVFMRRPWRARTSWQTTHKTAPTKPSKVAAASLLVSLP